MEEGHGLPPRRDVIIVDDGRIYHLVQCREPKDKSEELILLFLFVQRTWNSSTDIMIAIGIEIVK